METHKFIGSSEDPSGPFSSSRPSSSQQPQVKRYILVVFIVLATAGISAGITFYTCVQILAPKFNNNTKKWTAYMKISENHRNDHEYEVFTVPKYGNYFIHGLVWKTEEEQLRDKSNDYVWLEKKLKSYEEIARKTFCDSHVIFAHESQKMRPNEKIYVRFNKAEPNLTKSVFYIYEL